MFGTEPLVTNMAMGAFIKVTGYNRTALDYRSYFPKLGVMTTDSVIYKTALPSERLTPAVTSTSETKLKSSRKLIALDSGGTATVTVWVRKSQTADTGGANYNGAQQRLILERSDFMGFTSDTVLATASAAVGTWEQLSGNITATAKAGVVAVYVDCSGTAGWINVDDWTVT